MEKEEKEIHYVRNLKPQHSIRFLTLSVLVIQITNIETKNKNQKGDENSILEKQLVALPPLLAQRDEAGDKRHTHHQDQYCNDVFESGTRLISLVVLENHGSING